MLRVLRLPARRTGVSLVLSSALCVAPSALAQSADAGLQMPPPPPDDPQPRTITEDAAAPTAAAGEGDASAPTDATTTTSPSPSSAQASTLPPPPPGARPSPARGAPLDPRARRRAAVTLRRIEAVIRDQSETDASQRRMLGVSMLIGGGVCALAGVIPFAAPPPGASTPATIITGASALTLGAVIALGGAVTFATRGFWEELDEELRNDPVMEPEHRLSALVSRWNTRVARERSAQRAGAFLLMGIGAVSAGFGVVSYVNPLFAGGIGLAFSAPFFAIGALYIPLGVAALYQRTPAERALRILRASHGSALDVQSRRTAPRTSAVRIAGVGLTPTSLVVAGAF